MYIILFLILAKEGYAQNNSTLRLLGAGEEIKKHSCYLMTPSSNLVGQNGITGRGAAWKQGSAHFSTR